MTLPLYLAMTAAEISAAPALPEKPAYMACHFSAYSTGLSNLPRSMPDGSMLIVNDRTPVHGHDPKRITEQLGALAEALAPESILLDFQRQECGETAAIVKAILEALDCPVGVTEFFAKDLSCPVFLSPPPLYQPLAEYIKPWEGREIWLEAAPDSQCITVTKDNSRCVPCPAPEAPLSFVESRLHCHYQAQVTPERIQFTLQRTRDDLHELLAEAQTHGITRAIGLYQQLRDDQSEDI